MKTTIALVLLLGGCSDRMDFDGRIKINVLTQRVETLEKRLETLDDCLTNKMLLAESDYGTRVGIQTCLAVFRRAR